MDRERRWGLSLASLMFLTSTLVQCQNQTTTTSTRDSTTPSPSNTTTPLDEIIPGNLKMGSDNVFEAPQLFGGQPFSLKTNPVTGEVDFQTKTIDVQIVKEARDREEASKVAELHEDMKSRVPSAAHLPIEAREEEYDEEEDVWGQPIKRADTADTEYYDEEPAEAREPIVVPHKGYPPRPTTTPKEEDSFMSIFASLFGGEEEEKKPSEPPPRPPPYKKPPPSYYERTTVRVPEHNTRAPEQPKTTERQVYQSHYQQTPERPPAPYQKPPERYNPYQQVNRPNERPQTQRPYNQHVERPNYYQQPPNVYQVVPEKQPFRQTTTTDRQSFYERPPERVPEKPQFAERPRPTPISTTTTTTSTTTTTTTTPKPIEVTPSEWQNVEENRLDNIVHKNENIDRQDTNQNEVKPANLNNVPDYYNFINLPVHYSTKDTAIPLISTSYANTKVQGMGASKYEKNKGPYSNHKYDSNQSTSKKPNYWSSRRPSTTRPAPTRVTSTIEPIDFDQLEYDETLIGSGADFGGYGHKAGVKVDRPTTKYTPTIKTSLYSSTIAATTTTTTTTTSTKTTPVRTTSTQPAPVKEYDEYDYEAYPAQVNPMPNPITTSRKPDTTTKMTTTPITTTTTRQPPPPPLPTKEKEPDYEYYDYDTEAPLTTTTPKYKVRYPSLPKDKIRRPAEKVEVVVPTKWESTPRSTTSTTTTTQAPSTTVHYFQRPTTKKEPAPVFEDTEAFESRPADNTDDRRPIIVTAGKKETDGNKNIVLVPAKTTSSFPSSTTSRQPEGPRQPTLDYTTEFTVGVVHGHGGRPGGIPPDNGHFIASSIAASPFDGPDEPFRPIARPPGMSASFQVSGDDDDLEPGSPIDQKIPSNAPPLHFHRPTQSEPDIHEPHEFIPSPQFHRPDNNHFVVGTSFNTKPNQSYKKPEYNPPPQPSKNELLGVKPKPQQRPGYYENEPDFGSPESLYKPTKQDEGLNKDEDYYDPNPPKRGQQNVELSTDYEFDGIQTKPKPGEYVIFPKPHLSHEINANQVKKPPNTPIPHFHDRPATEPTRSTELSTAAAPQTEKPYEIPEQQQEVASTYPRPHWEKTGKPSFLLNNPPNRPPLVPPPQMNPNLIPPGSIPPRYRKPIAPPNLPPVRKNYEGNYQSKPKQNLPNILPQFRPNAKIGNPQRPYRPLPNRRKENFPYRIQNEPDTLMHRDFEVDEGLAPKFITNRVKLQDYDQMMQKRLGIAEPPPPRRVQRTPVTTLQMLQQTHGVKKQQMPSTREDQADPTAPLVPPVYKPFKDDKKDVFHVYPIKTPFNSNIKIEDPDKIDYNYNKTEDQVPLLKPSKKKDKPKPDFPYGFVPPDEKFKRKEASVKKEAKQPEYLPGGPKGPQKVRPNIQDYMPSGAKLPNEKKERIDMNLHMQSNNQWNQVSTNEEPPLITKKEEIPEKVNPPTQYHTLMKNTNASEFTLGAIMHTLPEQTRKGQVSSVNIHEQSSYSVRPSLNVNERISNGKIVTVSMPLDVKEEQSGFQAPFQASSTDHVTQGWNKVDQSEGSQGETNTTENANTTFSFENFKPELIGGFKPIYNSPDPELESEKST